MARVTPDDVKLIYEPPGEIDDTKLGQMIDIASTFVDEHLLEAGLSESVLKEIERYLTPYFTNVLKPQALSSSVLGQSSSRTGSFGTGLLSDPYAQRAIDFDTSGTLANLASEQSKAARGEQSGGSQLVFISDADEDLLT